MSTYLEELATLAAKIGDDNAKATLDLGWIGPQERDALVDAALGDAVLDSRYDLLAVADAVLADYQPKPRTITSAAELKAESDGTILRDEHGMVGVVASDPDGSGFRYVLMVGDPRPYTFASWAVSPSIVLFTPEATA